MKLAYRGFIYESKIRAGVDTIIQKGKELFHGTIEEIKGDLRPSSLDGVVWFSEYSGISQTYIPESSMVYTSASSLALPNTDSRYQKSLGIEYDVSMDENNRVSSWKCLAPPEFIEFDRIEYENIKEYSRVNKELELIKKKASEHPIVKDWTKEYGEEIENELNEIIKEEDRLTIELKELTNKYNMYSSEKMKIKWVVDKLKELGYSGEETNNYRGDVHYKLKTIGDKIAPANHKENGKLYYAIPMQDLKMYDISTGESDLTDKQYYEISTFEFAESKGYDGVIIDDFAQSSTHGNVGHTSFGIFKNSLNKLKYEIIDNVSHPDNPFGHTEDFKNWKKSKVDVDK